MALSSRKGQPTKSSAHYAEVPNNETVDNDADVSGVASHDDQTLKKKWKAVVPHESIGTLQDDGLTPMEIETLKTEERTSSSMPAHFSRHWKSSPYAVRCVPPTWTEEIQSRKNALVYSRETNICSHACHSKSGGESMCCCLILSGMVCGNKFIKAKRLGNMVVLREERAAGDFDEEHASQVATARWMLGPYWPFLVCVTYPLVYGVTIVTLVVAIPRQHPVVSLFWVVCTVTLLYNLFSVSCRDPGVQIRFPQPPHGQDAARWRWSDDAQSYYPRGAVYDPDCGCVIEEYDHVCPWTGTAIGKNNMQAFQGFVASIMVCMVLDILLLTGALE